MNASTTVPGRHLRLAVLGVLVAVCLGLFIVAAPQITAQQQTGSIAGAVTADRGEVRALRVTARDTVNRIAYTVFTQKGRYQIQNLPASTYEVRVIEEQFDSPVATVVVKGGATATADVAVKSTNVAVQGAGASSSTAQENYGATRRDASGAVVELVDFDTLYPPSPARDVMVKNCFGCHGPSGFHGRKRNETGWRTAVNRMFRPDGRVANMSVGVPQQSPNRVSEAEREQVIKYLTANFGPDSKPRDLRPDPLVRDEQELAGALYVTYEMNRDLSRKFADGTQPRAAGHSAFASPSTPGVVWVSANGSNSILQVNTKDLNFQTRTKEHWIDNPQNQNMTPHGIAEQDGKVYFTELAGDRISALDIKTGTMERWKVPTEGGGPHSLWPDSKGNIWDLYFASSGKIGRVDTKTRQVKEYEPVKDLSGYGLIVDSKDRVWMVSLNTPVVLGYRPDTDKWQTYAISGEARRVTEDLNGNIWVCEFFANKIAMIDPNTGKVTEYELPLKYGNPYDIWPDAENNLWIENATYNSLVKFDQKTKKFTYVPFPIPSAHTPKLDRDKEGTIWFTLGSPKTLVGFKPKGNRPAAMTSASAR